MAQIKHIAIATQDADKTARFYIDVFGLKEIAKLDNPNASGYYLSDGNINLAILDFKNDQVSGPEYGQTYSGIHHIGFEVASLEEIAKEAGGGQFTAPGRHQPGAAHWNGRPQDRQRGDQVLRSRRGHYRRFRDRLGGDSRAGLDN